MDKKITFAGTHFTRFPDRDFSDDGNYFTSYKWNHRNDIELTKHVSKGEAYISIRHMTNDIPYDEYSTWPSFNKLDMYNGINIESTDIHKMYEELEAAAAALAQDLDNFYKNGVKPEIQLKLKIDEAKRCIKDAKYEDINFCNDIDRNNPTEWYRKHLIEDINTKGHAVTWEIHSTQYRIDKEMKALEEVKARIERLKALQQQTFDKAKEAEKFLASLNAAV